MKRKIIYFSLIFIGLLFVSCNNESSDILEEETVNVATVQFSLNTNTRTVLPQTIETTDLFDFNLQVQGPYTTWTRTYTTLDDFLSANITLDVGTWTFTLTAKKGGTSYSASTTAEIIYGDNLIKFDLALSDMGTGTGSFSLTLDFSESENADKVTSANCSIQKIDGSAVSVFSQISISVQNEAVTYSLNSVPAGNYRVFITLYSGDLELNTWREIVVISSDLQSSATRKLNSLDLYHITYVFNDDEVEPASFESSAVETYTRNTESFNLSALTRYAYRFEGWYEDTEFSGEPVTVLDASRAEDVTLYAKWSSIRTTYTVEHYQQNVIGSDYSLVESDTEIKVGCIGEQTTAEAKNYEGFSVETVVQKEIVANGATIVKIYYVRNIISYTFYGYGGQWEDGSTSVTITGRYGNSFSFIEPTRIGYEFLSWGEEVPSVFEKDSKDFYAEWSSPNMYYIVFDPNGGFGTMKEMICAFDDTVRLPSNFFKKSVNRSTTMEEDFVLVGYNSTNSEYTFKGWNTKPDGSGESFNDSSEIKNLANKNGDTITLYAQWIADSFKRMSYDGSGKAHIVSFSEPFYICDHEVTNSEYEEFCCYTIPSNYNTARKSPGSDPNKPTNWVSWHDAIVYCNLRSISENLTPVYSLNGEIDPRLWNGINNSDGKYSCSFRTASTNWDSIVWNENADGYRLPTIAEWLYTAVGNFKDDPNWDGEKDISNPPPNFYIFSGYCGKFTSSNNLDKYAWHGIYQTWVNNNYVTIINSNSSGTTHDVKTKLANSYGIYDMSGNVSEWCWDWYGPIGPSDVADPVCSIPVDGYGRGKYCCGDNFSNVSTICALTDNDSSYRDSGLGFRVCRSYFESQE